MQQLTLWDETPELVEQDTDISSSRERDIIIEPRGWADGDTSPAQLERLALLSLGEVVGALFEEASGLTLLNYHLDREVLRASRRRGYTRLLYRIISTSVIGDEVLCACDSSAHMRSSLVVAARILTMRTSRRRLHETYPNASH